MRAAFTTVPRPLSSGPHAVLSGSGIAQGAQVPLGVSQHDAPYSTTNPREPSTGGGAGSVSGRSPS